MTTDRRPSHGIHDDFKRDKHRKKLYRFKEKNFRAWKSKYCSKCGKRKPSQHHYLCNDCWNEKNKPKNIPDQD